MQRAIKSLLSDEATQMQHLQQHQTWLPPPPCTPERFKEICLRPNGESCKETLGLLEYLFAPHLFLGRQLVGASLIKQYLIGGDNYDVFKKKGYFLLNFI